MSSADIKAQKRARFENVFVTIRHDLLTHFASEGMPQDAIDWYKQNLDYNVPGGKLNRGISVVDTVEIIKGRALSDEEYTKAAILGWCVELLQAYFLVADDIMDSSHTRRGQPCWFRQSAVGMIAINDSFMLEAAIYHLLKQYFRREAYYGQLLEIFHETTYQTEMGQLIDLITAPEDVVDLNKFSLKKHSLIVIYKTAFYSFYLPVALAMYMSGVPETYTSPSGKKVDPYAAAKDILLPLGEYFQIQDDFLDYSAPPEQLGKIGTDIQDNKCSWVINTALSLASPTQRQVLDENYGRKNADMEAKVKTVYAELNIPAVYEAYEDKAVGELKRKIEEVEEGATGQLTLRKEVFTSFLDKIYKRTK